MSVIRPGSTLTCAPELALSNGCPRTDLRGAARNPTASAARQCVKPCANSPTKDLVEISAVGHVRCPHPARRASRDDRHLQGARRDCQRLAVEQPSGGDHHPVRAIERQARSQQSWRPQRIPSGGRGFPRAPSTRHGDADGGLVEQRQSSRRLPSAIDAAARGPTRCARSASTPAGGGDHRRRVRRRGDGVSISTGFWSITPRIHRLQLQLFCRRRPSASNQRVRGRRTRPREREIQRGGKPCGHRGAPLLNQDLRAQHDGAVGSCWRAAIHAAEDDVCQRSRDERVAREPLALRALDRLAQTIIVGALLGELLRAGHVIARVLPPVISAWTKSPGWCCRSLLHRRSASRLSARRSCGSLDPQPSSRNAEQACLALADIIVFRQRGDRSRLDRFHREASWRSAPGPAGFAALDCLPLPAGWRSSMALLPRQGLAGARCERCCRRAFRCGDRAGDDDVDLDAARRRSSIIAGACSVFRRDIRRRYRLSCCWPRRPTLDERRGAAARPAANHGRRSAGKPHSSRPSSRRLTAERGGTARKLIRFVHALVGRLARRPSKAAGRRGQHVCDLRPFRLEARRRGRRRHDHARRNRRASRRPGGGGGARGLGDHGRDGAAEHRHADRRPDHHDGWHVHRRDHARRGGSRFV